jgi:hypothetical protein
MGQLHSRYWGRQLTTPDEACLYVGSVGLIFASCGFVAGKHTRQLRIWRWLTPLGLLVATMPRWWPDGYWALLHVPALGQFRAAGRYTLITTLGLCLLAGRGFDYGLTAARFRAGVALAVAFGVGALAWGGIWSGSAEVLRTFDPHQRTRLLAEGSACWLAGLACVALWRAHRLSSRTLLVAAGCELAYLYHGGTTPTGWPVRLPAQSPVLSVLLARPQVGLVAGPLQDVPVRVGLTTAYPNLGIVAPPPNYLLEVSMHATKDTPTINRLKTYGVTHGVYEGPTPLKRSTRLEYVGPDPALDAILPSGPTTRFPRQWRVENYADAAPAARCARRSRLVADWSVMYVELSMGYDPDEALYAAVDVPPDAPGPRAMFARVVRWDGRSGEVEHDGTCDLVLRRTHVPGWMARLDDGPEFRVGRADGGLQAIQIPGSGITRVRVRYRPPALTYGLLVSLSGLVGALVVLGSSAWRARWTSMLSLSNPHTTG